MKRGYAAIGLDNPKNVLNIGSVLRAAQAYDVAMVAMSGDRIKKSGITDTGKAYRQLPFLRTDDILDIIPYDCVPVAVDIIPGAISLHKYIHPERAFYIFGPEDSTCRDVIYIPTTICMNLAATVNVILYDRLAKELR